MHSLPLFVKLQDRPVILLGEGDAADAKRRLLERAGAQVIADENAQAMLAIVAIEDEVEAQAAVVRLKARGVLVNAVDRPSLCDFTLPAIIDRDPVLIAIGTGGASAGLAKALRQRLEALLPQSLGMLAASLGRARAIMRARWSDASDRRRAIDAALAEGGTLDPFVDTEPQAVTRWLDEAGEARQTSRIEHIRIASDDPDDLTLRAARLLGQADMVFHSADVSGSILDRARADAARICCDAYPEWNSPGLALWLFRG